MFGCVCVSTPVSRGTEFSLCSFHAGGRDTTGISRPTKRMPVGADAVGLFQTVDHASAMKLFLYLPTAQFTNSRATDRPSFEPGTCQSDRCHSGSMGQQRTMAYNLSPSIHQALHPTCLGLSLIDFHTSSPTTNFSCHTPQTDLPPRLSRLHSPLSPLLDNKQPTSFESGTCQSDHGYSGSM